MVADARLRHILTTQAYRDLFVERIEHILILRRILTVDQANARKTPGTPRCRPAWPT